MDKTDAGFLIQRDKEVMKINCKKNSHIKQSYCESLFQKSLTPLKRCKNGLGETTQHQR